MPPTDGGSAPRSSDILRDPPCAVEKNQVRVTGRTVVFYDDISTFVSARTSFRALPPFDWFAAEESAAFLRWRQQGWFEENPADLVGPSSRLDGQGARSYVRANPAVHFRFHNFSFCLPVVRRPVFFSSFVAWNYSTETRNAAFNLLI